MGGHESLNRVHFENHGSAVRIWKCPQYTALKGLNYYTTVSKLDAV